MYIDDQILPHRIPRAHNTCRGMAAVKWGPMKLGELIYAFLRSDHRKCYLFSLVTPVYSLHFCIALFAWFNQLNDDDDDDEMAEFD